MTDTPSAPDHPTPHQQDHDRPLPPARARTRSRPPGAITPPHDTPGAPSQPQYPAYEVGYGKPPRHSRFKPGQSGNPKGRPKGAKGLNTMVRETLGSKIAVRTANGTKHISRIEAVLQKTVEQAMKGNPRAQLELMKLWRNAVPDVHETETSALASAEELTAADLAILEAFREELAQDEGDDQ